MHTTRFHRSLSLALAAVFTLGILLGVDQLAQLDAEASALLAQQAASAARV